MFIQPKIEHIVVAILVIAALIPLEILAEDGTDPLDMFYFGLSAGKYSVKGDFDGESFFLSDEDLYIVPALEPAASYSVVVGSRFEYCAFNFGYRWSNHTIDWFGAHGEADSKAYGITFRFLPLYKYQTKLQPYVLTGFDILRMKVKDGYAHAVIDRGEVVDLIFGDETYKGFGLNIGLGTALFLPGNYNKEGMGIALFADFVYHYAVYGSVQSSILDEKEEEIEVLNGSTISVNLSLVITANYK
jgi:hypothetical protein